LLDIFRECFRSDRFVGDFGMGGIVCVKFVSRVLVSGKVCADDVAYVGILPLP